jgi:hypothetical protein
MAATFIVNGPDLTISFVYTGPLQTIYDIANGAAHLLWKQGMGPHGESVPDQPSIVVTFEGLTPEQKLAILDEYIANTFVNLAKSDFVQNAVATAQAAAEASAKTNLNLS